MNHNTPVFFGHDAQSDKERCELLRSHGPQINVVVSNPMNDLFKASAVKERKNVLALLDTGASLNSISISVAKSVGLMQIDEQAIRHVSGLEIVPVFQGKIAIPQLDDVIVGEFFGGSPGSSTGGYQVLLGRPFLKNYILNYEGRQGRFSLSKYKNSTEWTDIV